MPVTLAQAKIGIADDVQETFIDTFRKSSWLFDNLTFDDVVTPSGGGATLTYGYMRVVTQPTAAFRAINAEYTPQEATKVAVTADLKPFGGSYQIDRVLGAIARGREISFQTEQKTKAAKALFNDALINGDTAVDANSFDGLSKALTGTTQEDTTGRDWSATTEDAAFGILDDVDALLGMLDGPASAILGNKFLLARIRSAARRAGYFGRERTDAGFVIETYNGVPLIDPGEKAGATTQVIAETDGASDLFAVRLGIDGLHAISLAGQPPVRTWLPDFDRAGAVKTGEVEAVLAIALKTTKAAAVLRDVDRTGA